jgi:hypothetical protein
MKRNLVTWGLASACVSLAAVVAWQAQLLREQKSALTRGATVSEVFATPSASGSADPLRDGYDDHSPIPTDFDAGLVTNHPHPPTAVATNWPNFDWRLVESEDYQTYVKNLRAIGCPEQTVRDIVTADVRQAFAAKRAEVAASRYGAFKFNEFNDAAAAEFARQRREVDEGMNAALRQLLGADVAPVPTAWEWKLAAWEQQLAFLPEDQHRATLEILDRTGEIDVALPRGISGNQLNSAQAEELQLRLATFDWRKDELQQVLGPEAYEQLDMLISWTGDNLRQAMAKFHPTEEEFTVIFREWRAHDLYIADQWANGKPDPGNAAVFDRIREFLGDERYREYRSNWWK